jgi:amino acid transporter
LCCSVAWQFFLWIKTGELFDFVVLGSMENRDDLIRLPSADKARFRALTTARVVLLVVAAAAPLASVIGNMPLALGLPAGIGMPATFLAVTAVLLCFAAGYAAMSREIVSTGAFYTYIGKGLGKPAAIVAAYCAILAYGSYTIGLAAAFGYFASLLFAQIGLTVPWIPCALVAIGLIGITGYRSLDLSAKVLAFLMVAEFGILAVFDICALMTKGAAEVLPLTVWHASSYWRLDIGAVIPFVITSFIGFESAALYGEETANPHKSIPRATMISLLTIGIFYLVTVWIIIGAVGTADIQLVARAQGGNLLLTLAEQLGGGALMSLMGAFFVTSVLATFLALHNATSRYLFALGRDALLPSPLARFHPIHHSPHIGSLCMTALELLMVLGLGLIGVNPYLGIASAAIGLGTIGIIAMQMACALAVPFYYRKSKAVPFFTTKLLPFLGFVGLAVCLVLTLANYGELTGSDNALINHLPASLVVLLVASLIYAEFLRRKRPTLYAKVASARHRIVTDRTAASVAQYSDP